MINNRVWSKKESKYIESIDLKQNVFTGDLFLGNKKVTNNFMIERNLNLKDKYKINLFEGDIIQGVFRWGAIGGALYIKNGVPGFDFEGCFYEPINYDFNQYEKVGNIHEGHMWDNFELKEKIKKEREELK